MKNQVLLTATVITATLVLSACSEGPKTIAKVETEAKKEPAKVPEAITAQRAFDETYKPARAWATDLLALSVTSGEVPDIKNEDGKAGLWTVIFVSPSRKEARSFTYAVVDSGEDIQKGVNVSNALRWDGATPTSKPFSNSEFAVDSDAAYKAALEKAAGWLKKHPNQKATFRLGNASRFAAPVWYVMWGTTKNGYAALVNATTGAIVK
uniref:Lipoprotein n=1 Tax=Solibacter usitatus (strain Ellin6076) TaxID=234267 RepID=Q01TJ3_SOLUE